MADYFLDTTAVINGYVQVAASLEVRPQVPALILVSADADLNVAEMAEGLPVENPNKHR